jgi:hypothetical protein
MGSMLTRIPSFLSSMKVAVAVVMLGLGAFVSVVAYDHIYTMQEEQEWQKQHPGQHGYWQATVFESLCYNWQMTIDEGEWEMSKTLDRHQ